MARVSQVENPVVVAEILKEIKQHGGYRRLESPFSYFTVKKLRDKGLVTLKETEKTAVKGKKPSLYVVTGKGNLAIQRGVQRAAKLAREAAAAEAKSA